MTNNINDITSELIELSKTITVAEIDGENNFDLSLSKLLIIDRMDKLIDVLKTLNTSINCLGYEVSSIANSVYR